MSAILPSDGGATRLREVAKRLAGKRVAVLGDLVADVYIYAKPERVSREAPVLIVSYEGEDVLPGGAGNTLRNLSALGARTYPLGTIGRDEDGRRLRAALEPHVASFEGIAEVPLTITKTRVLAGDTHTKKQQVLRIDKGDRRAPGAEHVGRVAAALDRLVPALDAIVVSDYGYELATAPALLERLRAFAATKPAVVDSRYALSAFSRCTVATPNEEEAASAVGAPPIETLEDALAVGRSLHVRLDQPALLVTRGSEGMILFERGREPLAVPVAGTKDIVDVTGAGDTVASVMALALAARASFAEAAYLANIAASVVVMKRGPQPCSPAELELAIGRAEARGLGGARPEAQGHR